MSSDNTKTILKGDHTIQKYGKQTIIKKQEYHNLQKRKKRSTIKERRRAIYLPYILTADEERDLYSTSTCNVYQNQLTEESKTKKVKRPKQVVYHFCDFCHGAFLHINRKLSHMVSCPNRPVFQTRDRDDEKKNEFKNSREISSVILIDDDADMPALDAKHDCELMQPKVIVQRRQSRKNETLESLPNALNHVVKNKSKRNSLVKNWQKYRSPVSRKPLSCDFCNHKFTCKDVKLSHMIVCKNRLEFQNIRMRTEKKIQSKNFDLIPYAISSEDDVDKDHVNNDSVDIKSGLTDIALPHAEGGYDNLQSQGSSIEDGTSKLNNRTTLLISNENVENFKIENDKPMVTLSKTVVPSENSSEKNDSTYCEPQIKQENKEPTGNSESSMNFSHPAVHHCFAPFSYSCRVLQDVKVEFEEEEDKITS